MAWVTKLVCVAESPKAMTVEREEMPSANIEYSVEFVEPIDVLTLEKYDK